MYVAASINRCGQARGTLERRTPNMHQNSISTLTPIMLLLLLIISLHTIWPCRRINCPGGPARTLASDHLTRRSRHCFRSLNSSCLKLPQDTLSLLNQHSPRSCGSGRLLHHASRHILGDLARGDGDINVVTINVIPGPFDEEGNVVREIEDGGDECQAKEEEEDGV